MDDGSEVVREPDLCYGSCVTSITNSFIVCLVFFVFFMVYVMKIAEFHDTIASSRSNIDAMTVKVNTDWTANACIKVISGGYGIKSLFMLKH